MSPRGTLPGLLAAAVMLLDLEPRLVLRTPTGFREVDSLSVAQGIVFLCPRCSVPHAGGGAHYVLVWFSGRAVPDEETPGPGRWGVSGHGLADLTLSPSIHLRGGCGWHGFVDCGVVRSA